MRETREQINLRYWQRNARIWQRAVIDGLTLPETAREFNLTAERVRQIVIRLAWQAGLVQRFAPGGVSMIREAARAAGFKLPDEPPPLYKVVVGSRVRVLDPNGNWAAITGTVVAIESDESIWVEFRHMHEGENRLAGRAEFRRDECRSVASHADGCLDPPK